MIKKFFVENFFRSNNFSGRPPPLLGKKSCKAQVPTSFLRDTIASDWLSSPRKDGWNYCVDCLANHRWLCPSGNWREPEPYSCLLQKWLIFLLTPSLSLCAKFQTFKYLPFCGILGGGSCSCSCPCSYCYFAKVKSNTRIFGTYGPIEILVPTESLVTLLANFDRCTLLLFDGSQLLPSSVPAPAKLNSTWG